MRSRRPLHRTVLFAGHAIHRAPGLHGGAPNLCASILSVALRPLLQIWERQPDGSWLMVHDSYVCDGCGASTASSKFSTDIAAAKYGSFPEYSQNHVRLTFTEARVYTWDGVDTLAFRNAYGAREPATDQEIAYIQAVRNPRRPPSTRV